MYIELQEAIAAATTSISFKLNRIGIMAHLGRQK